ncbi:unnamed protein product [Brachionus calyciflorus]|uniref:Uncharacterized protein n=1 Tax=Brachionus calyciflorus TaxID=104777 RepID=A0A813ZAM2_9BILA|nr:unnamed protein product [Brachionus calyciflorus]
MALKNNERSDSEWSFYLDRLFDPEQLYFTPMEELIKRYKKRNLLPVRMYNLAKKYGNVEEKRTRIIQAPQMERPGQRIYGTENFYYPPPKVYYCNKPNENRIKKENVSYSSEDENEEIDYETMMMNRKNLRNGLNQLDLNPEYLKKKKNLTEVERRVLNKMIQVDKEIQTDPIKEKTSRGKKSPKPVIIHPTPLAMKNIEEFLAVNKWRLIDLFKDLDKNKEWHVKKEDFIRECKNGRLEIPDPLIDELINTLNNPKTNKLNYRELARGRSSHLSDRRNDIKTSSIDSENLIAQNMNEKRQYTLSNSSVQSLSTSKSDPRYESSRSISQLSNYLQVPKIDSNMDYYPSLPNDDIKTVERSVSVASSRLLVKRSNSELSSKKDLMETKSKMEEMRHRSIKEYTDCLQRTKSLNFKCKSSLLNGLVPPNDQSTEELIRKLKVKTDEKKYLIKQAEKEAKLRNRRNKLTNQI